jgi:hypothetical protein
LTDGQAGCLHEHSGFSRASSRPGRLEPQEAAHGQLTLEPGDGSVRPLRRRTVRVSGRLSFANPGLASSRGPACDVALFLPFQCSKERQTAAKGGTKRNPKIVRF